jgi:TM2 domain-containing membrane protein YozV
MAKKRARRTVTSRGSGREVNWVLCLVMSVIFGWIGVDRFIMGKVGTGILKLITLGGLGIWWLVDVILIATKYNYKNVKWVE